MEFNIVVCTDSNNGIAKNNKIPWSIVADSQYFQKLTTHAVPGYTNVIIMGRNTAADIQQPLTNRINYVITQNNAHNNIVSPEFMCFTSLNECLMHCKIYKDILKIYKIFVIGGQELYREALSHPYLHEIHQSVLDHNYECERVFPFVIDSCRYKLINTYDLGTKCDSKNNFDVKLLINVYEKYTCGERMYLDITKEILARGHLRETRNGRTYSLFGKQIEFNLQEGFPLLTTKKMYLRPIFEELMFFLRGQTDVGILKEKNVHIWDANTTKEFIEQTGLSYEANDMGPMYGFQFRSYSAEYTSMNNIGEGGIDQIKDVLELLKKDPHSRRILMTSFNPKDAKRSVLYPCHGIAIQFYVEDGMLCCHMYQRSADWVLGVPFNIASYALMTEIFANMCDMKAKRLVISFGDVHVYEEHVEEIKKQFDRIPYKLPVLNIRRKLENFDFEYDDVELAGYKSYDAIKVRMIA